MTNEGVIKQREKHDQGLDCLRIIAVWMVLSVHSRGYLSGLPDILNTIFTAGANGPVLFLMLSGYFAIPSITGSKTLSDYYQKKAIRILPVYWTVLLIMFITDVFIFKSKPLSSKWILSVFFLNTWIPSTSWTWWNSMNYFWTMPHLVGWYIVSPLIVKKLNNSWKVGISALVALLLVPYAKQWLTRIGNPQFSDSHVFSLFYVFLFGMLAWHIAQERKPLQGLYFTAAMAIIGWLLEINGDYFIYALISFPLICILGIRKINFKNKVLKQLVSFLSNISYSVYVSHYFIMKTGEHFWPSIHWSIAYVLCISFALLLGTGFYYFVERPLVMSVRGVIHRKNAYNI